MAGHNENIELKIGFITSEYPHPKVKNAAGIATSLKNLVDALVKRGVKVFIFVYGQDKCDVFLNEGVEIHLIQAKHYKLGGWYLYRKHINRYVESVVRTERINLLEAPDWTGITAFMKFSVPLVIRFHGSDAYFCKLEGRKQKLKNFFFEKMALRNAKAYIAPTSFAGQETQKIFGLYNNNIKTIPYGLKLKNFDNKQPEVFNKNTILYIGTIIRKKGVLELAQIFSKVVESHPEVKLVLIGNDSADIETGSDSTLKLVEKRLSEKGRTNTTYLGKIPYSEAIEQIKNAHVCVFPSFAETLGMVTIESMALQKPVVNTSLGWAQELIDDGVNGYLVHPSNIEEYSQRIGELLDNDQLCREIGKMARLKIEENFDINKIVDVNIEYYKSILR